MKVYLFVAPGTDKNRTMCFKALGSVEIFTLGFSSMKKARAFIDVQQSKGRLGYLGKDVLVRWLTLKEYTDNPNNDLLNLDPPNDFHFDMDLESMN